jgi:hypothetical protein
MSKFLSLPKNVIRWYVLLPTILSFTFIVSITTDHKELNRDRFEKFLEKEYKKAPCYEAYEKSEKDALTQPDLAAFQNYLMTVDPHLGYVPKDRLIQAHRQTEDLINANPARTDGTSLEWSNIPANMGGRTRAIMWDPNYPGNNRVLAGGVTGGLWHNEDITDIFSHWTAVDDFWSNLSISCITYDPNNTQIFYTGTGEAQTAVVTYRESSGVGAGIFKSTDSGTSWELLESTQDFEFVTDINVRNEDGVSVIYAGVVSGVYHGTNHQSTPSDGLYRSTDGGITWEQVLPNITGQDVPYPPSSIAIQTDGRIYVGTMRNLDGNGGATILYSDEGTTGSWTVFEDYREIIENDPSYYLPGRVILMPSPSEVSTVYAIIAAGNSQGFPVYRGRYILKTLNKGVTWSTINKPDAGDWANLAWHAMTGTVDPNNSSRLYVGGLDVWNTNNTGTSWYHVSDWSLMYSGGGDEYVHADQHAQVFKSGSSDEAIFSSDGGVFYTGNATSNSPVFEEKNKNYNTLQFYSCDIHPAPGTQRYIGGLQDNGTLYYTGTPLTINSMVDGGDGAYCFYDKDQPQYFITSVYYNQYSVFLNGNIINSIDVNQSGIFINPADYDYKLNTLYANAVSFSGSNANKLLRISNILQNPSDTYITVATGSNTYFSHIKYSPFSPEGSATLFAGTNGGKLFRVDNAQATPVKTEIGSSDFPPASISCIAIGGSEDTLLVTFSNYGVPSVWQTYDGGATWQMVEGNLPDMPIRWAIYHPQNTKQALLATEIGVWSTNNLDQEDVTWTPDIQGFANVRTDMLKIREADNMVLAASHGRGLFTTEYPLNPATSISENSAVPVIIYPNPSDGKFNIFWGSGNSEISISITDINGKLVFAGKFSVQPGGIKKTIDLTRQAKGTYFCTIHQGETPLTKKLVIY